MATGSLRPAVRRILFIAALLFLASCSNDASEPTVTATNVPTAAPTTTSPPTTTQAVLTTRDLFDEISPSLAFVTTDLGVGSGVLIDGGYVVTNAHVVWPFDTVRVVFPDGTEIEDAPVVRSDVYEDLAVIGPIETGAPPLTLSTEADFGVGDTVFLVGYPGEVEDFPMPAITQGVISRIREWPGGDLTFIQTDALIAGGQSGGALVSEHGEVLGISGLGGFSESNFALVAAAEDLSVRVAALLDGSNPERFVIPTIDDGGTATEHEVDLASFWHEAVFVLHEPVGTEVTVEIDSADHVLAITDALGFSVIEPTDQTMKIEFVVEFDEPHFVFVNAVVAGPSSATITSTHPLTPWSDPDDDAVLRAGDSVRAVIDISSEYDVYRLDLTAGDTVTITVDGLLDPTVYVDLVGNPDEPLAFDLDSGGGLFGTNAQVEFTAPDDDEYLIIVNDELLEPGSGYLLTVE